MNGYTKDICPKYDHAAEIIGKRWTGLILLVLIDGPFRFSELSQALPAVSDRVLSQRLKELECEGIVHREVFPETPVRIVYSLTEKGHALEPVIRALEAWATRWVLLMPEQGA